MVGWLTLPFVKLVCYAHVFPFKSNKDVLLNFVHALGPTLKLKRFFVAKKYAATVDAMYAE